MRWGRKGGEDERGRRGEGDERGRWQGRVVRKGGVGRCVFVCIWRKRKMWGNGRVYFRT